MKVTIKEKQKKEKNHEIPFDEIPTGYVYVTKYSDGPIALKLNDNKAVLLCYENDDDYYDWFEMADGFKGTPAYKVLGKLTEVIVEEE